MCDCLEGEEDDPAAATAVPLADLMERTRAVEARKAGERVPEGLWPIFFGLRSGKHRKIVGEFEGFGVTADQIGVALPEKLDLARLILHELRLIATFDRAQFPRAAVGQRPARQQQRQQPDCQKCEYYKIN